MANRFAHLIPQQQATEGQTKPGNRFAHLIPKKDKVAAKPLTYDSQSVNRDGKGDMGLAPGEVAASTYAQDIARSAASGLRSGAEMLAGTVGDVQEMSGNAAGWLANKAGLSPQAQDVAKKAGRLIAFPGVVPFAPTTEQVRGVTNSVAGEAYQPQTTPGEFARTIGEFAPNVAVGGPGGVARKAAMTVVPAVISEGAGQLAKGTEYEPIARVGGAVVGALASGGKGNATKQLAKNAPTQEDVAKLASQKYKNLRRSNVSYDRAQFDRIVNYSAKKLNAEGIMPEDAPRTHAVVRRMADLSLNGTPDFNHIESIRKGAGAILREGPSVSNTDKAAAAHIVEAIDRFMGNARTAGGNGRAVAKEAKEARELAQRSIMAKKIDDLIAKADPAQAGFQSGIRNKFSSFLSSNEGLRLRKLDPELYQAMFKASKGTVTTNLVSALGRLGVDPTRAGNIAAMIPLAGSGYSAYQGDYGTAGTLLALGSAAKFASRNAALKFANDAKKVALAGRQARKSVGNAVRAKNTATAATTGLSANQARDGNTNWPEGAFMQDANGRFYTKEGRLIPASQ